MSTTMDGRFASLLSLLLVRGCLLLLGS